MAKPLSGNALTRVACHEGPCTAHPSPLAMKRGEAASRSGILPPVMIAAIKPHHRCTTSSYGTMMSSCMMGGEGRDSVTTRRASSPRPATIRKRVVGTAFQP